MRELHQFGGCNGERGDAAEGGSGSAQQPHRMMPLPLPYPPSPVCPEVSIPLGCYFPPPHHLQPILTYHAVALKMPIPLLTTFRNLASAHP